MGFLKYNMKYCFFIFSLLVSIIASSQQKKIVVIDNRVYDYYHHYFPNTIIEKNSISLYFGLGKPYTTGKLTDYYNQRTLDVTMSLDYYHDNNLAFSFYIMHTDGHLKKDVNINNKPWTLNDSLVFDTYGISMGYSVLNTVHWRMNPFGGLALVKSELASSNGNKYKIGTKPSPVVGLNFSYRFINVKKEMQRRSKYSGPSNCFGINTRIAYVPFAVNGKKAPFSGGILYMTIGITPFNIF